MCSCRNIQTMIEPKVICSLSDNEVVMHILCQTSINKVIFSMLNQTIYCGWSNERLFCTQNTRLTWYIRIKITIRRSWT